MKRIDYYGNPGVRIAVHALFWFIYLLFASLNIQRLYKDEQLGKLMYRIVFTLPVDMIAAYLTVYLLLPSILFRKKYLLFAITFIVSAVCLILLQRVILWYYSYPVLYKVEPSLPFFKINWLSSFTNIYLAAFLLAVVKLVRQNFSEQKRLQSMQKEQVEAELKFLKAQVHPHFLFNTLNNLYGLTLDRSEKAPEVVLRLSDLLNYILYECNEPTILVRKEIKLIENFLALERIRYGDSLSINFKVEGETAGKKIAPMLLLPFVENAFKHGVSKVSSKARVMIHLEVSGPDLLIDDEPLALRVLVNHIGKIPWLSIVKTCTNPLEAIEVLKSHKVDLVFLDIQMPELSGLDFLESLSSPPAVIFTTAYRQFAADAFDLDGLDYLVKPVSFPRFMKAVNKYIERFGPKADLPIPRHPDGDDRRFFFIKQGRKMVKLFTDEILNVENLKDYVQIFTPGHKFIYKARITNLEEELQEEQFIRIHKSYLVPLGKIESVSPTEVTIAGIEIPVGRTYRQIVLKRLGIREGRGTRDEGRVK